MVDSKPSQLILSQKKPWNNNANPIWLASTVCLQRNIEKYKFPGKLDSDRKKQIIALVSKELLSQEAYLAHPYLIKAEEIGFLDKEFLVEHFLSTHNYVQAHLGEGFILDQTGEFLVSLNMLDHMHFQLLDCKGELENIWSRLVKIETLLGKAINYSFTSKFGFLTADPTQCGTALSAAVFLQVPGLIHSEKVDQVLENYADESLIISGIQGSPNEIIGDIIVAKNNYTLGLTEENIISALRTFTTKVLVEENSTRNQIKRENNAEFKDKVSRAYGILIHSYQIEAIEALNALSLLKLGVEANWVEGISNVEINELFFNCRRAHLLCQFQEKITQEEIPHKRAEYIHKTLKDIRLLI
jgi:protein arginine kinase